MAAQSQAELALEARIAFTRLLLDKVRSDSHPSRAHMTLIEETIPPQLIPEYLNVLLEKALTENQPSIPMLQRMQRVIANLG